MIPALDCPSIEGSNVGTGPPHNLVRGASVHTLILYINNLLKPQASVGCKFKKKFSNIKNGNKNHKYEGTLIFYPTVSKA